MFCGFVCEAGTDGRVGHPSRRVSPTHIVLRSPLGYVVPGIVSQHEVREPSVYYSVELFPTLSLLSRVLRKLLFLNEF